MLPIILLLLYQVSCGRVRPYGPRSLTMSNVNPNGWSEYNFTMIFDTTLPSSGILVIEFPNANYPDRLGLRPDAVLYAPYPKTRTFVQNDRSLEIQLGEWPIETPLTVTISGIINSQKQGGTGNFKVYTKLNSHIVDINRNFAVIGLAGETIQLLSAQMSINNNYAGEVTDYLASLQPSQDLNSRIDFIITFPDLYDLSQLKKCSCNVFTPSCTVHKNFKNQILVGGNQNSIPKGTSVQITFNDIVNPSRKMKTPLFNFRVIERNTNNTLQESSAVNGLEILAGQMKLVMLEILYYQPYIYYIRDFRLQFRPKNGFQYAKISTDFYQVMSCQITRGLLDPSKFQDSICSPLGRDMFLSNIQSYVESDYSYEFVEVRFRARIGDRVILTNPVEIYTYKDSDYLYLADQDSLSVNSQLQIVLWPIVTPTMVFAITFDDPLVQTNVYPQTNAQITIVYTAKVGISLTTKTVFGLEIPQDFQGVPECTFKDPNDVMVDVTCEFGLGFLNITNVFDYYDSTIKGAVITIKGLLTPETAGNFPIGTFVQDQNNVYYNNDTFVISPPTFKKTTGQPELTTAVSQLSIHQNQQTAIQIQLQLDCDISAGVKNMNDPYVPFTTIEVYFYQYYITNNVFDYDLGSGLPDLSQYGCQFQDGMVASSGNKLSCVLFHGINTATPTFANYAMVKIQGYAAITATNTSPVTISFKIPVKYPSTIGAIPRIRVDLVKYNQKVKSTLRSQSFNIGAVKNAVGNSLVVFSGPVLENPKLQVETTLTYKFKTVISLAKSKLNGIYFEIPSGFTFNSDKLLVSIDGVYQDPEVIQYFPTFIFIMTKFSQLSNGITHNLIFERVDLPVSLPSSSVTHNIKTASGGQFADTATFTIPTLTKGSLLDISLTLSSDSQMHPYANYSISFTTSMKSYDGSMIIVDFPLGYDIQASNAYLDNIPYTNLKNTTTNTISYDLPTIRKFRVLNFAPLIKGQRVSIGIFSVKNPMSGTFTIGISTVDKNGNIIEDGSKSVTIGSTIFSTQILTVTSVESTPNNKKALALYTWYVNVDFTIPKLSQIQLFLPGMLSIYSISAAIVSCRIVQDSVIPLKDCLANELGSPSYVQMITDYPIKGKAFKIEYYGYLQLENALSGLTISITYNSQVIATGLCPTVAVTDQLTPSQVTLDFYPKNEGEIAYYNFYLEIGSAFTITSNHYILIRFPFDYDYIIGIEKMQVKSNTLQGALKMAIIPYHIKISGFYELSNFKGTLDISLLGVINPNRQNNKVTGTFLFGIMDGNKMVLGNTAISGVIPQLAPLLIQLNKITSSVSLSRYASTFTFEIYPLQKVLSTVYGGQLYADFPNNFIIDSFNGGCETTSQFSFFASCKWDYFRFLFQTNNQDWYADRSGQLDLTITNVLTPDDDGETNNFIIYNYDSINKIVLGRTYANLHSASLIYNYDGLQIDVNLKQPFTLEVGSYSDEIIMNITDTADFTLTLSPNVLDSQIIITPNPVQIVAGSKQAKFRVAAPRTILLQTYYIQWSKTGDTLPVTYAPLRLTPLQMVKGTLKRKLTIEKMEYMPRNGTSYPLYITTNNPPYQQLLIRIGFKMNVTADVPLRQKWFITDKRLEQLKLTYAELVDSGVDITEHSIANLSSTQLEMAKLQYSVNYDLNISINYPSKEDTLTLYYRLRGYDADSFELDVQEMIIPIRDQEFRKPKILETKVLEVTRSTATFQVTTDIKGFIFYVYADQHMPNPIFEETKEPNLDNVTLSHSNPLYGVDYVRTTTLDVNFTISKLSPNHNYEIFIFVMNLNKVDNPTFMKVFFQTLKSQRIALLTLKINQATIDNEVKMDYIQKVAEMIGITKARLLERTTECKQTTLDVSTSNSYLFWNLIILPDPSNMNEYTKPLILAQTLNSRRAEIQKFITRLDDEPFFTLEEISDNIPSFVINPEMIDRTTSSISVRFKVSYCGKAYLTVRKRENSQSLSIVNETIFAQELQSVQFPSAYQIKNALNESNQVINQTKITIQDTDAFYQYNYTDLDQKTVYDIYISLENDFIANPELFSNDSVARFTAKTQKIIIPLNIYSINYQGLLPFLMIINLLLMI
ncbi:unnamed protein product (macronuclear) [Paramecium tetraurelia]|uniref:EGF-like domain-containing protein n=1 Tax=Paramecium tetraurelia TaxID=5888 RepID=A0CJM6_PARTE|nr:uncharacterized protein GSPATT00000705001 [Paramecium tetraurelia]CAK70993.1 unnamed protein product [Paramecium tetraurelia]|eukprot:XP_001438390.1 hypothetical protein (macronuclear) [Paramecium tetraurelia strain d4-2]